MPPLPHHLAYGAVRGGVISLSFGREQTLRGVAIALIIAALIISELIVHASGKAAAMIGAAMAPIIAKPLSPREKAAKAVAKLANDVAKPAKPVANRNYYLARLEREFPRLAERVAKKELSVYAACVEAGLRKAPKKRNNLMKIEAYANAKAAKV